MLTAMLSLAGVPFTAGFYGKFLVFAAAVKEHQFVLIVVGVVTVAAGFYYYLRVITAMYWQEPNDDTPIRIGALTKCTIGILAALIFLVGIFPQPVLSMLKAPDRNETARRSRPGGDSVVQSSLIPRFRERPECGQWFRP
jgi:NADH-quinone oxidoreductase subunit N